MNFFTIHEIFIISYLIIIIIIIVIIILIVVLICTEQLFISLD
jgi:hypothetical protein